MGRPLKQQVKINFRLDPATNSRLRNLSEYDRVTLTEKVEQIINNEYRWKFGILERWFTYTGRDFEELPLPLDGPTIIEQSQRIQSEEERLARRTSRKSKRTLRSRWKNGRDELLSITQLRFLLMEWRKTLNRLDLTTYSGANPKEKDCVIYEEISRTE